MHTTPFTLFCKPGNVLVLLLSSLLLAAPTLATAQTWQQDAVLEEVMPAAEHNFGYSSAIEGSQALFGVNVSSARLDNYGAVLVYEKRGAGWQQIQRLESPRKGQKYYFGASIDVSQGTAIIGEYYGASDRGLAHMFTRDPATGQWAHAAQLAASNAQLDALFGVDVAIDGDHAIVASPLEDNMGNRNQGAAYIFSRDAQGQWTVAARLLAPDGVADEAFGSTVDIFGDLAIVGSTSHDTPNAMMNGTFSGGGAAYLYERDAQGQWAFKQKLVPSDISSRLYFGGDVSIHQDRIVVGAAGADDHGTLSGAAYVFTRNGAGGWDESQRLAPTQGSEESRFGATIRQNKDNIVIGLQVRYFGGINRPGAAYVFQKNSAGMWQETQELLPADSAQRDDFGRTIALTDRSILITSDGSNEQGKVYVFRDASNQPPVLASQSLTTPQNTALDINLMGTDPDGDSLIYSVVTPPTMGVISNTFRYTPNVDVIGQDQLTVRAFDGDLFSPEVTITIDITESNAPPVANDLSVTTSLNTAIEATLAGTDADGDTLTYEIATAPQMGTVVVLDSNAGTFRYTPGQDVSGEDTFTYTVKDATATSQAATVRVTIEPGAMVDMGMGDMSQDMISRDMSTMSDMTQRDMGSDMGTITTPAPKQSDDDSGCASTGGDAPASGWMLLVLGVIMLRIRRSKKVA